MVSEGTPRSATKPRRRRPISPRLLVVVAALLIVGGIAALFVSTLPQLETAAPRELFIGTIAPGYEARQFNRTGFGFVELQGEELPCGLHVQVLTVVQWEAFNETRVIPTGGIDCDNPSALIPVGANAVVFYNEAVSTNLSYRVVATFFNATFPWSWLLYVGIAMIAGGGVTLAYAYFRD